MVTLRASQSNAPFLPPRDSALLLAHILGRPREWVVAHPEAELTPEQQAQFTALVAQAANGVPLPYLLGEWEFFGLKFKITPDVLIPRPETELLVEIAIKNPNAQNPKIPNPKSTRSVPKSQSQISNLQILDIGTGSGIIAVTLAVQLPDAQITATDISPAALAVAQANAERHGIADRIEFVQSDLLSAFITNDELHFTPYDLMIANLPYIPSADLETLPVAKHEPRLALDGGPDGLSLIRRLLAEAPRVLASGGSILLEIEYRQGEAATQLARAAFPTAQVEVHKDLAGLDRVVEIKNPKSQLPKSQT